MAKEIKTFEDFISDIGGVASLTATKLREYTDSLAIHYISLDKGAKDVITQVIIGMEKELNSIDKKSDRAIELETNIRQLSGKEPISINKFNDIKNNEFTKFINNLNPYIFSISSDRIPELDALRLSLSDPGLTAGQIISIKRGLTLLEKINKLKDSELHKFLFVTGKTKPTNKDLRNLIDLSNNDSTINIRFNKDLIINNFGVSGNILVNISIDQSGSNTAALYDLVFKELNKDGKFLPGTKYFNSIELHNIKTSPSVTDDVESIIVDSIFGKSGKAKARKFTRKKSIVVNRTKKAKAQAVSRKQIIAKQKLIAAIRSYKKELKNKKKSNIGSLYNLQKLINYALHDRIKKNMGDSNDPPIQLRYQTGRFAKSAKLLTLTREGHNKLYGAYTFMRYPYDTFMPGGRLYTPQRDPRQYIESSIRDIAQNILRTKFPGIQLELK